MSEGTIEQPDPIDKPASEPPADTPRLTAHDVIDPTREYGLDSIECTLGIPYALLWGAVERGELGQADPATHRIQGQELLTWLEEKQVDYRVTALAGKLHGNEQGRRAALAAANTPTLGDKVAALIRRREEEAEAERRRQREKPLRDYVELLGRVATLNDEDLKTLADLVATLEIPAERIDADQRTVQGAGKLVARYDQATRLNRPPGQIPYQLGRLANARPELFDGSSNPPRLLQ